MKEKIQAFLNRHVKPNEVFEDNIIRIQSTVKPDETLTFNEIAKYQYSQLRFREKPTSKKVCSRKYNSKKI